jgi:hypothetical protein
MKDEPQNGAFLTQSPEKAMQQLLRNFAFSVFLIFSFFD